MSLMCPLHMWLLEEQKAICDFGFENDGVKSVNFPLLLSKSQKNKKQAGGWGR